MREEMKADDEESKTFVKKLLDDRNVNMTKKILELSKASPDKSFFFAIGSAHYPGKIGIVKLLTDKGATVTRLGLGDVDKVD